MPSRSQQPLDSAVLAKTFRAVALNTASGASAPVSTPGPVRGDVAANSRSPSPGSVRPQSLSARASAGQRDLALRRRGRPSGPRHAGSVGSGRGLPIVTAWQNGFADPPDLPLQRDTAGLPAPGSRTVSPRVSRSAAVRAAVVDHEVAVLLAHLARRRCAGRGSPPAARSAARPCVRGGLRNVLPPVGRAERLALPRARLSDFGRNLASDAV